LKIVSDQDRAIAGRQGEKATCVGVGWQVWSGKIDLEEYPVPP